MKSFKFLLLVFGFLFVVAFLTSCGDQEVEFSATESNTYESEENLEAAFEVISSLTFSGMDYVESNGMARVAESDALLNCAVLTIGGKKDNGQLEIDFGDGCTGPDGRIYKGTIILEFTGRRYEVGSIVHAVLQDFYIDDYKLEGTRKSTNVTENILHPKFEIEVTNGKITWPDESGTFATWDASRTHTWSISEGTGEIVLSIEGNANGVNRNGTEYYSEIVQPLVLKSGCLASSSYVPVQGMKKIVLEGNLDINVNYGNGSCDRTVSISVGRQTKDISF